MPVSMLRPTISLLVLACMIPNPLSAATYRVGGGGGCTHATIQAAVNAAAGNPGADTIRITRSLNYTNQNVIAEDTSSLRFEGGWADCLATASSSQKTVISGAGGNSDPVFSLRGNGSVAMANLEITGGDQDTGGGGIEIVGGPKLVTLTDLFIHNNQASFGGGISVINTGSTAVSDVQLLLGGTTSISGNAAVATDSTQGGGGIHCRDATVKVYGGTYLISNSTNSQGGGIHARNCAVDIGTSGLLGGALIGNTAQLYGGGLSAGGGRSVINVFTVDANSPATIIDNVAAGLGGGIYVYEDAQVSLYDSILRSNVAGKGGAVALFDSSATATATRFLMQGTTLGAPSGAQNCVDRERCNRIIDNAAQTSGGAPAEGSALYIYSNSMFGAIATFRSTRLSANDGLSLVGMTAAGDAAFDGSLVDGNTSTGALFDTPGPSDNLVLSASTVANNVIAAGQPVIRANSACSIIGDAYRGTQMYRSIVWQPGRALLAGSGSINVNCYQFILGNDLTSLPPSTLNRVGDPLFQNAMQGDFRVASGSPALDYAPAQTANSTRDLGPRVIELPGVANDFGPHDLGAYELGDRIFADGFE